MTSLKPIKEKKQAPARGHKTQRNLAQTRPKQQPPGDRLKTAKHHLNPDANPAKNPPPQRGEVTSLKPLKEKKQAPARGHKTQRNLGQETVKHHCFSTNIQMQTYVSPTPFFSPPPRKRRGVGGYICIYLLIHVHDRNCYFGWWLPLLPLKPTDVLCSGLSTASGIGDYASKAGGSIAPHKQLGTSRCNGPSRGAAR